MHLVMKRIDGSEAERWKLGNVALVVGRGDGAHARIADNEISRQHFEMTLINGVCSLKDLNSRNGTWVNGQRVPTATLKVNDQIRAGETHFFVTTEEKNESVATLIDMHVPKKLGAK